MAVYKEKSQRRRSEAEVDAIAPAITSAVDNRYLRVSPGPAFLTEEYLPSTRSDKGLGARAPKGCRLSARAGKFRTCHVEMEWINPKQAALLSQSNKKTVQPGPHLRLCTAPNKPGVLVRVTDPLKAKQIATSFCRCVNKKGTKSRKTCAIDVLGRGAQVAFGKR